jgi:hypothetical protein
MWVTAMLAFDVLLNGKKVCTAGVGGDGGLSAIVSARFDGGEATNRKTSRRVNDELRLYVGGSDNSTSEYIRWQDCRLCVGDEVCIRIGEGELASKPRRRERADPAWVAEAEAKYVESAAKRLGWTIVKPGRSRTK